MRGLEGLGAVFGRFAPSLAKSWIRHCFSRLPTYLYSIPTMGRSWGFLDTRLAARSQLMGHQLQTKIGDNRPGRFRGTENGCARAHVQRCPHVWPVVSISENVVVVCKKRCPLWTKPLVLISVNLSLSVCQSSLRDTRKHKPSLVGDKWTRVLTIVGIPGLTVRDSNSSMLPCNAIGYHATPLRLC